MIPGKKNLLIDPSQVKMIPLFKKNVGNVAFTVFLRA